MPDKPPSPEKPPLVVVSDLSDALDLTSASSPVLRLLAELLEGVAANDDQEQPAPTVASTTNPNPRGSNE